VTGHVRASIVAIAIASLLGSCSTPRQAAIGVGVGLTAAVVGSYSQRDEPVKLYDPSLVAALPGLLIATVSFIDLVVLGAKEAHDETVERERERAARQRARAKTVVVQNTGPTCTPRCGRGFTCKVGGLCIRSCVPLANQPHLWTCGQGYRCTKDFQGCEPATGLPMRWRE